MESNGDQFPVDAAPDAQPEASADNASAFQEALKKAHELAAGLRQHADGADPGLGDQGYKRPNEDSLGMDNPAKRVMTDAAGNFDVAAAQAEAQARAAKIMQGIGMPAMASAGEEVRVPNRMVGIIIGKSGETINRLQADSNARIQCAPANPGNPQEGERVITVTGTPEAIAAAKMMIQALVEQGPDNPAPQQPPMPGLAGGDADSIEMLIPQGKVGLIIGKGGETIKRLQQQASCHMQMVQDGPYAHAPQKPLRIQGNPQAMDHAKRLVEELMAERDAMGGGGGGSVGGGGGGGGGGHAEMPVPREMVGMVIGRGGESIKRIQAETGVRIQFSQDNLPGPVRQAILTGPPDGIPRAQQMVSEILERAEGNSRGGGGGGRMGGGGGGGGPGPGGHMDTCDFPVPGAKCGLVIGRGGETIRALQQETGCHIQLNRNAQCGPDEKVFTIRGDPQQISHAQNMIREKCDMPPGPNYGGGNQQQQHQGNYGQNMMGGPMGSQMQPMPGQMQGMGQQQMPGQMPMQQGMYGQQQQQMGQQQWGQYGQQGYQQQQQQPQDVQAQQQAWAQYYQQYYQQQQPQAAGQQPSQQQQGAQQPAAQAQQQPATTTAQPATSQAQGSAADIQAQWAEYYRQMGYSYPAQGQGQQQSQQPSQ